MQTGVTIGRLYECDVKKTGPGFNQKAALNIQETRLRPLLPLLRRLTNEDVL